MSARIIIGLLALLVAANACTSKRVRVPAADEVYARGTIAHDDESYEAAIREYRFFLDHYPLDPMAWLEAKPAGDLAAVDPDVLALEAAADELVKRVQYAESDEEQERLERELKRNRAQLKSVKRRLEKSA